MTLFISIAMAEWWSNYGLLLLRIIHGSGFLTLLSLRVTYFYRTGFERTGWLVNKETCTWERSEGTLCGTLSS